MTELRGGVYALSRDTNLSSPLKITGEVTLDLNGGCTRAQIVTLLWRAANIG